MSNLPICQTHFNRLHLFLVQHVTDILELIHPKKFVKNVESRNIIAFIKDTNFCLFNT